MTIHIAITRRVRPDMEEQFESALREFFQSSFDHPGVLGASMLVPGPGSDSREYGILRTFGSEAEREAFYASPEFQEWEERARTMTEGEPIYRQLHGLEAWFHSPHAPPPRWKMAVATLIGVYPTSLLLALTVGRVSNNWPLLLRTLIIAACMVALLTWLVMPAVTGTLRTWLQPANRK